VTDTAALHEEAMASADAGDRARRAGDHAAARGHFERALALERQAATAETTQPSRSILFRSAAWLALEAEDPLEAERLAACGLADVEVPDRVRTELRAVSEECRVRLTRLLPPPSATASIAIHLEGPAIGYGVADPAEVLPRTEALLALVVRAAERRSNTPFRRHGPPAPGIRAQLAPRLEQAAASVIVRLHLGGGQQQLWDENLRLVEDIRGCFQALGSGDPGALRAQIADDTYRANFEALAARLAPDGTRVSTVDFLGAAAGRSFAPVRLRRPEPASRLPAGGEAQTRSFVGELRAVDETAKRDTIKLITDGGETVTVAVHAAVMEDIVRPFYGQRVIVQARRPGPRGPWVLTGGPELADEDGVGDGRRAGDGIAETD
jgi:hypothetical protein